jgi:hypothetical protein
MANDSVSHKTSRKAKMAFRDSLNKSNAWDFFGY